MRTESLQRFRLNLLEKRHNLTDWLSSTPSSKKQIRLGSAGEEAAKAHLHVLDSAIQQSAAGSLGNCVVCHEPVETKLLEMDYACCVCLDHLSSQEKERLEYELQLATQVQQALLPQQDLEIPGLEVAALSRPATIVGGDYFDFYRFQDGAYGLLIADVVGHGMAASLIMASLQASLRILVPEHNQPAEVLERLNRLFHHNIRMTSFVSLFLGRFDPGTREFTYSNAGHNPPLLMRPRADGRNPHVWLAPTGAAIGLVEDAAFESRSLPLHPGDTLLLYTDGVTEASNLQGQEFGGERLAAAVEGSTGLTLPSMVQALRNDLTAFTQGQPLIDDITVLAARVL